ncbi:MAG: ABC transporter substrate-binding protein [Pseudomonadota bacterium]
MTSPRTLGGLPLLLILLVFAPIMPSFAQSPQRIVSIGGDVTEIIFALGEGERLVASDSTSVYPAAANEMPKVGYVRRLSAEGVLSLEPDLIIISGAAGPPEAIDQIRASGVKMVEMDEGYTIDAILHKTEDISNALGIEEKGSALAAQIVSDWEQAKNEIDALGLNPRILFFATLRDGAPRGAGTQTAAHGVITLLGGKNVFGNYTGYKSLSFEAAVAADPDVILVMSHHADSMGGLQEVINHPAISLTTAAQSGRVFLIDPVTVMQFSPRTPNAVRDLAKRIKQGPSAVSSE